jgi:hypothetical protein
VDSSPVSSQALAGELSEELVHARPNRFDPRQGARAALVVLVPLVIGYALGFVEASVLVTIGALNLLLVVAPAPGKTPIYALAVASVGNTLVFAAGTLIATTPPVVEVPVVGLGVFLVFLSSRGDGWDAVSFIAAVMFVVAVGLPVASGSGEVLRPLAVLIGGGWGFLALSVDWVLFHGSSGETKGADAAPSAPASLSYRSLAPHAAVVGATTAIGLAVGTGLGFERDYWIMLTVIVALRLDLASTLSYSTARIAGTVIGAGIAFLATSFTSDPWVLFPILALATAFCFATRAVNYLVYSVWVTITVIVLLNLAYSGGPALALTRIADTLIGGGLALAAALCLALGIHGRSRRSARRVTREPFH